MIRKSQIEQNEENLIKELKKHNGWGEVKVKNGYIVEVNKKVKIEIDKK